MGELLGNQREALLRMAAKGSYEGEESQKV